MYSNRIPLVGILYTYKTKLEPTENMIQFYLGGRTRIDFDLHVGQDMYNAVTRWILRKEIIAIDIIAKDIETSGTFLPYKTVYLEALAEVYAGKGLAFIKALDTEDFIKYMLLLHYSLLENKGIYSSLDVTTPDFPNSDTDEYITYSQHTQQLLKQLAESERIAREN